MPNAVYSPSLAAAPSQALMALEALAEVSKGSGADMRARADQADAGGSGLAASLLRAMGSEGPAMAALKGFEMALDEICERSAAESRRSVLPSHLSGWGIERSLLYLRIVCGLQLAGAESAAERIREAAAARVAAGRERSSWDAAQSLDALIGDMRAALEAIGREIAKRVGPRR